MKIIYMTRIVSDGIATYLNHVDTAQRPSAKGVLFKYNCGVGS